mgnify:CR=1 FL=1
MAKKNEKTIYANCGMCGNKSGYDKQSLKGSTWNINGCSVVLCISCEDELLHKIAKSRGIKIKYGDGGEIHSIRLTDHNIQTIRPKQLKELMEILEQHLMSDEYDRVMDIIHGYD